MGDTSNKVIEKVAEKVTEKIEEGIVKEKVPSSIEKVNSYNFTNKTFKMWQERDKRIDYTRSHVYADIAYKDNFKGDREVMARAGFLYYLK